MSGRKGWYNGKSQSGRFDRAATGDFAATDVGAAAADIDCLITSPAPLVIGRLVMGDAGPTTDEGKLMVFVSPAQVFLVKLTKDGGVDGTRTAAATWTYNVKDTGDISLATTKTPQRARSAGKMAYAPAGSYGLATYVDSELVLLDAFGEKPGTGGCS